MRQDAQTQARRLVEDVGAPQMHSVPAEIFDAALRELIPSNNRKAITELFNHRVTFFAIRHWRRGRRRVPAWAAAIVKEKISADNRRRLELEKAL